MMKFLWFLYYAGITAIVAGIVWMVAIAAAHK